MGIFSDTYDEAAYRWQQEKAQLQEQIDAALKARDDAQANERIALQAHAAEIKEVQRWQNRLVEHKQLNRSLNEQNQRLRKKLDWLEDDSKTAKRIRWLEGENAKLANAVMEAEARLVVARHECERAIGAGAELLAENGRMRTRIAELEARVEPPKAPAAEPAAAHGATEAPTSDQTAPAAGCFGSGG